MKILVILPFDRLWSAGAQILYNLVKGFAEAGDEAHVVLFNKIEGEEVSLKGLHIYSFTLPFATLRSRAKILNWLYLKLAYFLFVLLSARRSLIIANKIKPDVIYGFANSGAAAAYAVSKIKKIPNVTRLCGTFLYQFARRPFQLLLRFDEFLAFKLPCKYLIITNDGTKGDEVARILKVPSERIKFWMNGVDDIHNSNLNIDEFKKSIGIAENKKIILSVSRLVGWKRVNRIIEAMPLVSAQDKNAMLLVVGDGEERINLEKLTQNLDVKSCVKFVGPVSHEKVAEFMNAAEIFVSMYDVSNLGNPLLEAMICGKCVVTLDTGATGEVIKNNENGILLRDGSAKMVAESIAELLRDEKKRKTLGANARKYASRHFQTWEERIRMEVELIEKIKK